MTTPISSLLLFLLQLAIPLTASLLVAALLLPALQPLLEELCGGAARARFWVVFTRLVLYITPLLMVLLGATALNGDLEETLRALLIRALSGIFLALGATAFVIRRTIAHTLRGQMS